MFLLKTKVYTKTCLYPFVKSSLLIKRRRSTCRYPPHRSWHSLSRNRRQTCRKHYSFALLDYYLRTSPIYINKGYTLVFRIESLSLTFLGAAVYGNGNHIQENAVFDGITGAGEFRCPGNVVWAHWWSSGGTDRAIQPRHCIKRGTYMIIKLNTLSFRRLANS